MSIKTQNFLKKLNKGSLSFGQLLLALRHSDDVSQAQLAQLIGTSRGFICDLEKGRRTASIEVAVKISKALGYPKESLIKRLFDDQLREAKLKLKVKIDAA